MSHGCEVDLLQQGVQLLSEYQERLAAQDTYAVLLCLQALDAAGKDGTIRHVMSGVNPQGVSVSSFKVPSPEEMDHDFLWRYSKALPGRGMIGIFNRSYYEEVLVVRVHPELLKAQKLPPEQVGKGIWKQRYADINAFEQHLAANGTVILKFFLHVSREEQKKRFLDRIDDRELHQPQVGDRHDGQRLQRIAAAPRQLTEVEVGPPEIDVMEGPEQSGRAGELRLEHGEESLGADDRPLGGVGRRGVGGVRREAAVVGREHEPGRVGLLEGLHEEDGLGLVFEHPGERTGGGTLAHERRRTRCGSRSRCRCQGASSTVSSRGNP